MPAKVACRCAPQKCRPRNSVAPMPTHLFASSDSGCVWVERRKTQRSRASSSAAHLEHRIDEGAALGGRKPVHSCLSWRRILELHVKAEAVRACAQRCLERRVRRRESPALCRTHRQRPAATASRVACRGEVHPRGISCSLDASGRLLKLLRGRWCSQCRCRRSEPARRSSRLRRRFSSLVFADVRRLNHRLQAGG